MGNRRIRASQAFERLVGRNPAWVAVLCLILITLCTRGILIDIGRTQEFAYRTIAISIIDERAGRIVSDPFKYSPGIADNQYRAGRLVVALVPVFLKNVADIPLDLFLFLPLTGVMLPLVGYILARRLAGSELVAFGYGCFLAVEPSVSSHTYNVYNEGFGYLFYLLVVMASLFLFLFPGVTIRRRTWFMIVILFFVSAAFSYPTAEFDALCYLVFLALVGLRQTRSRIVPVVIICFTFSWLYDALIGWVLRHARPARAFDLVVAVLRQWIGRLAGGDTQGSSLIGFSTEETYFNLVILVLITVPIGIFVLRGSRARIQERPVFYALLATGIAETAAYVVYSGHIALKYVYMVFSLLGMVSIGSCFPRKKVLTCICLSAILIVAGLKFAWIVSGPWGGTLQAELQSQSASDWIVKHQDLAGPWGPAAYVAEVATAGRLLVAASHANVHQQTSVKMFTSANQTQFLYYGGPDNLRTLRVTLQSSGFLPNYLVIDRSNLRNPLYGTEWITFEAIHDLGRAKSTPTANVVFSDGSTTIFWFSFS